MRVLPSDSMLRVSLDTAPARIRKLRGFSVLTYPSHIQQITELETLVKIVLGKLQVKVDVEG